ncbi:putative disease resistance protein At3g14460 [Prosopis cineraria]|uniref:putative disease resistance protein At3g14460 n=1 Tax=Prosopis cineraria TaxID=364024 RepID=UPI00240FB258|nr:putative disease resistance protein At3g14460 [Prosopis cineraria]
MLELKEWIHFDGACFPCLKEIVIRYCPRLRKSLPPHMPCLEKLEIEQCGNLELESFPAKAFSAPKLESIHLAGLTHLKSLHEDMHTLLPCVHSLSLFHCPQLQSVPQKGLPLSLVQVSIHDCPKLFASRMSWGLHRLHSLHEFSIGENFETVESFPGEGLLPSNLKVIRFEGFSNLIRINSSGLLPLTSLQGLRIYNCPNLLCLPEEGLSRSISYLVIDGNCPFLTQRYQKNGQEWHKISHIPWILQFGSSSALQQGQERRTHHFPSKGTVHGLIPWLDEDVDDLYLYYAVTRHFLLGNVEEQCYYIGDHIHSQSRILFHLQWPANCVSGFPVRATCTDAEKLDIMMLENKPWIKRRT